MWKEAEEKRITLDDVEPQIFEIYLNHVYTGQLPTKEPEEISDEDSRETLDLALTYILCERLQDTPAKYAILLAILSISQESSAGPGDTDIPSVAAVQAIYNGTPDNSPTRRLITDLWACAAPEEITAEYDELPKEFLRDLTVFFLKKGDSNGGYDFKKSDGTEYLENATGEKE
jgi:hypothetical protein